METGRLGGSGVSSTEQGGGDGKNRGKGESDCTAPRVIRRAEGGGRRCVRHIMAMQEVALADARRSQWKHGRRRELPACTVQANY